MSQHCPLCGRANHCAMAAAKGQAPRTCWCRQEAVPQGLLERLPEAARGKACICQACIRAYNQRQQQQQQ